MCDGLREFKPAGRHEPRLCGFQRPLFLLLRADGIGRGAESPPKPHERLRVPRAGFRNEPEIRERVCSVEVDDELDYLPIADVEQGRSRGPKLLEVHSAHLPARSEGAMHEDAFCVPFPRWVLR